MRSELAWRGVRRTADDGDRGSFFQMPLRRLLPGGLHAGLSARNDLSQAAVYGESQ